MVARLYHARSESMRVLIDLYTAYPNLFFDKYSRPSGCSALVSGLGRCEEAVPTRLVGLRLSLLNSMLENFSVLYAHQLPVVCLKNPMKYPMTWY